MTPAEPDTAKASRRAARESQRARVIAEIRRLAAVNGGVPPGSRQFSRKTGIPRSALIGNLWARWNDALREAGLPAREGQSRLQDEDLLAAIAGVARTIGRKPTAADLATWRASGRVLSAQSTYLRHFGGMKGMLRALKRWAAADAERADILAMVAGIADDPEPEPRVTGAVYLLRHGRLYKIGCSRMVEQRVWELQQTLPGKSKLVHIIRTDDPHGIEAYWHRRFAQKRVHGEWFSLSAEDIATFRRHRIQ